MSAEFPSLAEVFRKHLLLDFLDTNGNHLPPECYCGWYSPDEYRTRIEHPDHVEQMWREACTVTTVEQLDALPEGTVILDADDAVLRRNPWRSRPGRWYPLDGFDAYDRDFGIKIDKIPLPARVIHHPDWETGK